MKRHNAKTEANIKPRGFTIAELMAVVLLIALIGGVGGGFYVGTYKRVLAQKAARDIVLAAKYARITAIEKQRPCRMELDPVNNAFQLIYDRPDNEGEQMQQVIVRDVYFKPVQFAGDVKFEDIQIVPVSSVTETEEYEQTGIVFSPNGTAQFAAIQVGDGKNHYTVSIAPATGKAKMFFGTVEKVTLSTFDLDAQE
jgi:Tfp pilus assembly protein FimT